MEERNTIKGIEVIAYKGMNSDMSCRDFYYEIGKTYKIDKVKLCEIGFHACLNPLNVRYYYPQDKGSRYFKVKLSGEIAKCDEHDTKVAATEITILEEISIDDIIKTTEWWKNDNVLDLLYWSDGFARVRLKDKYNLIDKQGKIFSEQWFEWIEFFHEGFARVQRTNGEYNFIDKDGKFLSEQWFNWVDNFYDGLAVVQRGDYEYNFIDKDGKFLSEQWFNWIDDSYDSIIRVLRGDGKFIKIDKTGKFIKNCSRIWEKLLKIYNRIWKRFI